MAGKVKYGKILAVVFLTVLIWVWADLAKTENYSISNAVISVDESANPNLWVSFRDGQSSVSIKKIEFKGPASRIDKVKRELRDNSLEFFLDAGKEGMVGPGSTPPLNLLGFLKRSSRIKQLGLTVESCDPNILDVQVVRLVKKLLKVKCVDEDRNPVKVATIEPAQVEAPVPISWQGERLVAKVLLTPREIAQARSSAIIETPYVELAPGVTRNVQTIVKITTPQEEDRRENYLVTATLGIALSPTLQGKYNVEVTNLDAVMSAITVKATPEAKRAYEMQRFPLITLYILDGDEKADTEQRRKVVYNFPEKYVRSKEIELRGPPVEARFELIPLPAETP